MEYITFHSKLVELENKINDNLTNSSKFLRAQVVSRECYLVLGPAYLILDAIDTILGIGAGLASLATLGKKQPILECAVTFLKSSETIFSEFYSSLLSVINPRTSIYDAEKNYQKDGLITNHVAHILNKAATDYSVSENFFKKKIASRLIYGVALIACVVTRIADFAIGILVALFSFFTFGELEAVNSLAFRQLKLTAIIKDLFTNTIKIMNPLQDIKT